MVQVSESKLTNFYLVTYTSPIYNTTLTKINFVIISISEEEYFSEKIIVTFEKSSTYYTKHETNYKM